MHIISSVGWLGAVATFLALALTGLSSDDTDTVRAAYLAMESMSWLVLVPLAFASLLTGIIQSLGTSWGLFRHYWVLFKLLITVVATVILLLYTQTLGRLADVAVAATSSGLEAVRSVSPVVHSAAALALLVIATALAVYKPRGVTAYGWRKRQERGTP